MYVPCHVQYLVSVYNSHDIGMILFPYQCHIPYPINILFAALLQHIGLFQWTQTLQGANQSSPGLEQELTASKREQKRLQQKVADLSHDLQLKVYIYYMHTYMYGSY